MQRTKTLNGFEGFEGLVQDHGLVSEEELSMISELLDIDDMHEAAHGFIDDLAGMGDQFVMTEPQRNYLDQIYKRYCS